MLETPHVAVGAAIASKIPNPFIAIPLAFASHFLLDKTLHWNPHTYTETQKYGKPTKKTTMIATVDAVLALAVGSAIAASKLPDVNHSLVIFFASFASVLPDVIKSPFYYFNRHSGIIKKWVDLERKIQVETQNPVLGLTIQFIVIVVAFWWISA